MKFVFLDVGMDNDNSDVDENVRIAITASAGRDQLSLPKYGNVLVLKLDKDEDTIWQIGVSKVFAG
jgi:hypothetical protein